MDVWSLFPRVPSEVINPTSHDPGVRVSPAPAPPAHLKRAPRIQLFKNLAIMGGLLLVADQDSRG
jgi:hypothetical protein